MSIREITHRKESVVIKMEYLIWQSMGGDIYAIKNAKTSCSSNYWMDKLILLQS